MRLRGRFRCGRRLLGGLAAILPIEALHPSGGVHQLLLSRKEGMAVGTNLQADVPFARRTGLEGVPASAGHRHFVVVRMYARLHARSLGPFRRDES